MAAYAGLTSESAASYDDVKKVILHRYNIHEEAHRRRFRHDRKKPEESYKNWGDRPVIISRNGPRTRRCPYQSLWFWTNSFAEPQRN